MTMLKRKNAAAPMLPIREIILELFFSVVNQILIHKVHVH